MTAAEIYSIIYQVTSIDVLTAGTTDAEVYARDIAVCMLHEEGLKPKEIAPVIGMDRCHIYSVLHRVQCRLADNLLFKITYLACIARMAELEGAA